MSEITDKLAADIKKSENELKAKKLMLKLAKKQEDKKYFVETKLGRFCLKALKVSTKPAADIYCEAQEALDTPRAFIAKSLVSQGYSLIQKAEKIPDNSTKKAWKHALAMADLKCELEEFITHDDVQLTLASLKAQVERLRPVRDPETQKQIKEVVDGALAGVASSLSSGLALSEQSF